MALTANRVRLWTRRENLLTSVESVWMLAILVLLPIRAATLIGSGSVNIGFMLAFAALPMIVSRARTTFRSGGLWPAAIVALALSPIVVAASLIIGRQFFPGDAAAALLLIFKDFLLLLSVLWARTRFRLPVIAVSFGVGLTIHYLTQPATFAVNPWKYGIATSATIVALGLAGLTYRRWISVATIIALIAVTVMNDYRSFLGILGLTLILTIFGGALTRSRVGIFRLGVGILIAGFALYQAVILLALGGALGERNQRVTAQQLAQGASLLSAGRPEWHATLALFREFPLGFGPGIRPTAAEVNLAIAALSEAGVDTSTAQIRTYMFGSTLQLHSIAADLWVVFGVGGLLIALAFVLMAAKGAIRAASHSQPWLALSLFLALYAVWDIAFSPIESNLILVCFTMGVLAQTRAADNADAPTEVSNLQEWPAWVVRSVASLRSRMAKAAGSATVALRRARGTGNPPPANSRTEPPRSSSTRTDLPPDKYVTPKDRAMDLHDYLDILRTYWRSTVATAAACLVAAASVSFAIKPTYTASSSVLISVTAGTSAGELYQSSAYARAQALNYVQVVGGAVVLQPVIDSLDLDATPAELSGHVTGTVVPDTSVINIAVTDASAEGAAALANSIAAQLSSVVGELSPTTAQSSPVHVTVVQPAVPPARPSSPSLALNAALGLAIGVVLGVCQALIRRALGRSLRRPSRGATEATGG